MNDEQLVEAQYEPMSWIDQMTREAMEATGFSESDINRLVPRKKKRPTQDEIQEAKKRWQKRQEELEAEYDERHPADPTRLEMERQTAKVDDADRITDLLGLS